MNLNRPAPSQPSPKGKEFSDSSGTTKKSALLKVSPFGGDLEGAGKTVVMFWLLVTGMFFINSCNNSNVKQATDSTTSGDIWISSDESLKPFVDSELQAFMRTYSKAKIHVRYKAGENAISDILDDSSRVVVAARPLRPDELAIYQKRGFTPELVDVAIDAIALIVNRSNTDTLLDTKQISNILSGKLNKWKDIDSRSSLGNIQIIFDNKNSDVVRYLIDSVNHGRALPANCYALTNTPAVLDYVAKNKDAVGFIGSNWISNSSDSATSESLQRIHIINVQPKDSNDFYPPTQYYIAYHSYPYCRNIYIIDPEARMGLGTGFANFVWGDIGQTIITRSGLLPAHASMRFIQLKNKFD